MSQQQSSRTWLIVTVLVILGLTAGLGLGLLFGWLVMPVKYVDTTFADLQAGYKEEYIVMVAAAYSCDGDLEKAQARLDALDAPNANQWLADLVDRYIREGGDEEAIRALVALAYAQGIDSPNMVAYQATSTPVPTNTPLPTPTWTPTDVPTVTPVPPTEAPATQLPTETPVPPTNTPLPNPTDTPPAVPTDTPVPPTNTSAPPTNTPQPQPTNTPKPPPTNTPKPKPPAAAWTIVEQRLVGPGEDAQTCEAGNLQIRATVINANGDQLQGVWIHDHNSNLDQVTGHKGEDPFWGPGEAMFEYGRGGGGRLCITDGQGGPCVSPDTREMPVFNPPPVEDLFAAGYCNCCAPGTTLERCRELYNAQDFCVGWRHYSWRVVFKRSF